MKSLLIRRGHELLEEGGVSEKAPLLTMLCSLPRLELAVGLPMEPAHGKIRQSTQSWDRTFFATPVGAVQSTKVGAEGPCQGDAGQALCGSPEMEATSSAYVDSSRGGLMAARRSSSSIAFSMLTSLGNCNAGSPVRCCSYNRCKDYVVACISHSRAVHRYVATNVFVNTDSAMMVTA